MSALLTEVCGYLILPIRVIWMQCGRHPLCELLLVPGDRIDLGLSIHLSEHTNASNQINYNYQQIAFPWTPFFSINFKNDFYSLPMSR